MIPQLSLYGSEIIEWCWSGCFRYWSGDVMWEYGYYIGGFGNVGLVWICWYNSVGYLCVVEWGLSVGVGILA